MPNRGSSILAAVGVEVVEVLDVTLVVQETDRTECPASGVGWGDTLISVGSEGEDDVLFRDLELSFQNL